MVGGGCALAVVYSYPAAAAATDRRRARSREREWDLEGRREREREGRTKRRAIARHGFCRPASAPSCVYTSLRKRDSARAARRIKKGERVLRPLDY